MTLYKWSQTASADATADSTINWAEGQSPSSVNDSARAMMAATAKYRDDIAGAIVTGGTSTAYSVSSYEAFDTLAHLNGQMIAFTPHITNGATVTLNVDSLGAKALRSAPGIEILAGTLVQGTPYVATYNNSDGAFYLHSFYGNPYNIPLGGMMPYLGATAPNSSFVLPYGQAVSRTTYATLFSLIGVTFGAGDGSTTFNIIDLRGRIPVPQDNMGGTAAGRITSAGSSLDGTTVGAAGGAQNYTLSSSQIPAHTHPNTLNESPHSHTVPNVMTIGGGQSVGTGANLVLSTATTSSVSTGITITNAANTGGGNPFPVIQPSIIVPWILRVI
jgi:microcystin-dependent protein